jgi:hypothetical protein
MSQLNAAYFVMKLAKCKDRAMTDFGRMKNYAFRPGVHFPVAEEAVVI